MEVFGQFIGWAVVTIVAVMATIGTYGIIMLGGGKIDKEAGLVIIVACVLWWVSAKLSPFGWVGL